MATQPPCYDRVNHVDCPKRSWCKEVGRSQCEKWVEYEKAHVLELEARHKEAERRNAEYENSQRIRRRISKRNRY